jgi:hypothetical protein
MIKTTGVNKMIKSKTIITIIVNMTLIFLSYKYFYTKWLGYESIPNTTDILDERNYAFAGYSFRKTGVPIGWTNMDVYKDLADNKSHFDLGFDGLNITSGGKKPNLKNMSDFNYPVYSVTDIDIGKGKDTIRLVQPFFDHPILGSYIYSLGIVNNPKNYSEIRPSDYRFVSLIVATVTGILLFLTSYLIFNNLLVSFFSLIIYSTVPIYVLSSRYALFENLLIPLYLSSISLIIYFKNKKNILSLLLLGVVSGLAFIIKETGIYILIYSIICLVTQKTKIKDLLFVILPFLALSLINYAYSFYLAPS